MGAFARLRKATIGTVMSACIFAWNNWDATGRIFMKFYIGEFFENMLRKFNFHQNLTNVTGTLRQDVCIFMIHR